MKKKAFTLAEMLITLGIIGIAAALTMPALIVKYEKFATVVSLKKAYSILSQAAKLSEIEHGDIDGWNMDLSQQQFAQTYFLPYLKSIKICTNANQGCFGANTYNDLSGYVHSLPQYSVVLSDGIILGFHLRGAPFRLHHIIVDINGKKGKNTLGRDLFVFYPYSNTNASFYRPAQNANLRSGLLPGGHHHEGVPHMYLTRNFLLSTSAARGCNTAPSTNDDTGAGSACAAVIAQDGWKIRDDYPW
jgi:prepilin-type N-terminal cleavage/methylation domain-containing protein